ncbi:MAG TPA: DNA-formamidopyrimidine glycosylase family protein, partial [Patescibacteria group bacterium]|nr:DNA-formamidopyrimidine glycosylase family protein [Patescibacteria group bacterium]
MPELPEVETVVTDLRPHLVGRTVTRCELPFPAIVRYPEPEQFARALAGMLIESAGRRGKYILLGLRGGLVLVVHLGMTGHLRIVDPSAPRESHTHAVLGLD